MYFVRRSCWRFAVPGRSHNESMIVGYVSVTGHHMLPQRPAGMRLNRFQTSSFICVLFQLKWQPSIWFRWFICLLGASCRIWRRVNIFYRWRGRSERMRGSAVCTAWGFCSRRRKTWLTERIKHCERRRIFTNTYGICNITKTVYKRCVQLSLVSGAWFLRFRGRVLDAAVLFLCFRKCPYLDVRVELSANAPCYRCPHSSSVMTLWGLKTSRKGVDMKIEKH